MQYYTFELGEESQDLCTIITPFGKYKYTCLPICLKCPPDIVQAIMENFLSGIDAVYVYIVDVGAFSSSWEEHVVLLDTFLHHLYNNSFTINPLRCEWAI